MLVRDVDDVYCLNDTLLEIVVIVWKRVLVTCYWLVIIVQVVEIVA